MLKGRKSSWLAACSSEGPRYTSSEVARICTVSLRQLQWWDERNVVSPRQDGHKRVYVPEEVIEVSVIAELRRKGFSLQNIRRVLRFLRKDSGKRLSEALSSTSDIHLLTDGKSIYVEEAPNRVIERLKNARQAMFRVRVTAHARGLPGAARKPAGYETGTVAHRDKVV